MATHPKIEIMAGSHKVEQAYGGERTFSNVEIVEFKNYDEVIEFASASHPRGIREGSGSHADADQKRNPWHGTGTWQQCLDLTRDGWPEGREKAEALRANLTSVMGSRSVRPRMYTAVAGFAPNVPAYLAGEPETMYALRPIETLGTGKLVHIVFNCCVSCGIDPQTMMLRGALVMALVDMLELSGYRCEITLASGCVFNGTLTQTFIKIKETDEGVNADTLAFWLANPASFRRWIFSIWEHAWNGRLPYGYGMPSGIIPSRTGDIYLNEAHLAAVNDSNAVEFLKKHLVKYGVEFES